MARLTFFAGEDKPDTREGNPANLPADPGAPRPHEGGDPSTASGNPDEEERRVADQIAYGFGFGEGDNRDRNGGTPPHAPDPSPNRSFGGPRFSIGFIILLVVVGLFVYNMFIAPNRAASREMDELLTSDFVAAVEEGRVVSVTYDAGSYTVTGTYFTAEDTAHATERKYTSTFVGADSLLELMQAHPDIKYKITIPSGWGSTLLTILPIILLGGLFVYFITSMNRSNNQQMGFGKVDKKKAQVEHPDVKFDDVAGVDEAVEEMREIKDFLSDPEKYRAMGAKVPRGCLLVGPPGTGKTLLARAVAGEAGVPFFSISGSDFVEMFVGVGASRVRDLFKQAKEAAPSIIFIDEIDAVGRQRGTGLGGGHDEREQTLNQLLVEMDGFEKNESVILIAATNRADILDPALLRPGRFDRQIVVDVPDVKGRRRILDVHAKNKPLGSDVDLDKMAQLTAGFTGADLMNLMNEAALLAARRNKKLITQREVMDSMERVIAGPERKGRVMDENTKRTIAYHESGHALVGHTLPHADPVHKITIVSRGRALGYTMSIPEEDKVLNTLGEIKDELAVFMGGRVAEELFCDDITTGASNDLERATKMEKSLVTQYGMSAELGTQVFGQANHEVFLGRDYSNTPDYSEETAKRIDAEVARIMKEAHDRAAEVLMARREQMDLMANVLMERETVEGEACKALLDNQWDDYLSREADIIAAREAEEAAARAKDAEILAAREAELEAEGHEGHRR